MKFKIPNFCVAYKGLQLVSGVKATNIKKNIQNSSFSIIFKGLVKVTWCKPKQTSICFVFYAIFKELMLIAGWKAIKLGNVLFLHSIKGPN